MMIEVDKHVGTTTTIPGLGPKLSNHTHGLVLEIRNRYKNDEDETVVVLEHSSHRTRVTAVLDMYKRIESASGETDMDESIYTVRSFKVENIKSVQGDHFN